MQLFVRSLQQGCVPIHVTSDTTVDEFKRKIQIACGIPASLQRLRYGSRELIEGTVDSIAPESTVHLLLRLVGGKGGFGSLLRVQGRDTKATTNFDACRDLSGRRLRDVNAVKKLEEWKNNAKERELEDIALEYIEKETKRRKKESQPTLQSTTISSLHKTTISKMKDAVESSTSSKKPKQELSHFKKPRFLFDASSSDEDSDEDERDETEGSSETKSEEDEDVDSFEDKTYPGKRKRSQSKD